ncbi:hypothetical protein C8R43DRAFT_948795 [Mycena crocata]|nr:hypothetical protein C8R43DRAFT_948795 [Mycena crocata]
MTLHASPPLTPPTVNRICSSTGRVDKQVLEAQRATHRRTERPAPRKRRARDAHEWMSKSSRDSADSSCLLETLANVRVSNPISDTYHFKCTRPHPTPIMRWSILHPRSVQRYMCTDRSNSLEGKSLLGHRQPIAEKWTYKSLSVQSCTSASLRLPGDRLTAHTTQYASQDQESRTWSSTKYIRHRHGITKARQASRHWVHLAPGSNGNTKIIGHQPRTLQDARATGHSMDDVSSGEYRLHPDGRWMEAEPAVASCIATKRGERNPQQRSDTTYSISSWISHILSTTSVSADALRHSMRFRWRGRGALLYDGYPSLRCTEHRVRTWRSGGRCRLRALDSELDEQSIGSSGSSALRLGPSSAAASLSPTLSIRDGRKCGLGLRLARLDMDGWHKWSRDVFGIWCFKSERQEWPPEAQGKRRLFLLPNGSAIPGLF